MSTNYQSVNNLKVSEKLLSFVNEELLKGTNISKKSSGQDLIKLFMNLAPKNKEFIKVREDLQKQIDDWHIKNKGNEIKIEEYKKFLKKLVT